jgi:hypothetical protein
MNLTHLISLRHRLKQQGGFISAVISAFLLPLIIVIFVIAVIGAAVYIIIHLLGIKPREIPPDQAPPPAIEQIEDEEEYNL